MAVPSPQRFAALTDAAIELIAEAGMRGLTHRAVDTRAGVPAGTTSAYLRTRKALIEAAVRRMADLDAADTATPAALGLDELAAGIGAVLDGWLSTGRTRTLARYACLLEATHHPELRTILAYGVTIREQARQLLEALGAPDPEQRGRHFVAAVDGLLFDRLIGAGALSSPEPGTPESRADLSAAVLLLLRAATAPR